MRIWVTLAIIITIITTISGIVYKINRYIDNKIELKYNARVNEYLLKKQNEELLNIQINSKLYKDNLQINQDKMQQKIKFIRIKDDTCEAKLQAIRDLQDLILK